METHRQKIGKKTEEIKFNSQSNQKLQQI